MDDTTSWLEAAREYALEILGATVAYLPSLGAALLVLLAGWVLARVARFVTRRLGDYLNRLLERVFRHGALSSARLTPSTTAILGDGAFLIVLLLAIDISARVAGLAVIAGWLDRIVERLPNLVVGAAIIIVGYLISVVVGEQVLSTARASRIGQSELIGKLAQAAVFVTTLVIGLDQIGVDVTFLVALFGVTVGAIGVGFSIAFGLGARKYVGNLVGARNARRELKPGASVRIGGDEGQVLEITSTHVVLDTVAGRLLVPAWIADEQSIVLLASAGAQGGNDG